MRPIQGFERSALNVVLTRRCEDAWRAGTNSPLMSRMEKIHYHVAWEPVADPRQRLHSSLGGYPVLPANEEWPVCSQDGCGRRMSLFLQIAVADEMGLPFEAGSVLSVFQCLVHDDRFEELDAIAPTPGHDCLPPGYCRHANYAIFLATAGEQTQTGDREPDVRYSRLLLEPEPEPDPGSHAALNYRNIKVGGSPFWLRAPKLWRCSCGSDMRFFCSIPANLPFPREEGSANQTNGRRDSYFLFPGFSTCIFACAMRCKPRAVVAVRQN